MPYQMWINGNPAPGTTTKVIQVRNPTTEEIIAFIGSLATGQRIAQLVATLQMKKSHLELGEEGSKKPWWYPYGKK